MYITVTAVTPRTKIVLFDDRLDFIVSMARNLDAAFDDVQDWNGAPLDGGDWKPVSEFPRLKDVLGLDPDAYACTVEAQS